MPYVQRDASGLISAIFKEPQQNARESLPDDHPDLAAFFGGIVPQSSGGQAARELSESDVSLIRVIEDIIDVLIDKNLLMFTDLPPAAREKIMQRKSTREQLSGAASLLDQEDRLF